MLVAVRAGDGDVDGADRLLRRAAGRAGDAGDADAPRRAEARRGRRAPARPRPARRLRRARGSARDRHRRASVFAAAV